LEEFYLALGANNLTYLVQEDLRVGTPAENQASSAKLRSHILERSKLFLHEFPQSEIKHDGRWLEKNLIVQVVSGIQLRRSLRGYNLSNTEKRTAACTHDRSGLILYVTQGYNSYQISIAICKHLLDRPTQQGYLTFESFFNHTLQELRTRGYNVERILRAKAAEARVAEEARKKQLEAEQQQIKEQEAEWKRQNQMVPVTTTAREERRKSTPIAMPGGFDESPEPSPEQPQKRGRGLFSHFKQRLGLENSGEVQQQLQNFLGGGSGSGSGSSHDHSSRDDPPPYNESEVTTTKKPQSGGTQTEKVSSPHAIQQNLLNAIQSCRAHDSSTLFSPPGTQIIKEQATYCDSTPSQNISFLADASNGTRIFISKTLPSSFSSTIFLSENAASLNAFATLLFEICDIYNVKRKAMHIFYDESGGTIAFNAKGSVFCNFRFWKQLHEAKALGDGMNSGDGKVEAGSYWWIVVAHELAHNIVKEHNAEHSFYTYVSPLYFLLPSSPLPF